MQLGIGVHAAGTNHACSRLACTAHLAVQCKPMFRCLWQLIAIPSPIQGSTRRWKALVTACVVDMTACASVLTSCECVQPRSRCKHRCLWLATAGVRVLVPMASIKNHCPHHSPQVSPAAAARWAPHACR
jgi:hypothetical protein